jgi:hypothetical protein
VTNTQRAAEHAARAEPLLDQAERHELLAQADQQFIPVTFNAAAATAHATLALYYHDLDRPRRDSS